MTETAQDFWLHHLNEADGFTRWVFEGIRPHLGHRVLEVGCGVGNFTQLLAAEGHDVTAIDINPDYVAATKKRHGDNSAVSVQCGDATKTDWPEPFDSVVMLDVLEHIEDDVAFLRHLCRALKPSGTLVLKVPAGQWLYGSMDRAIGHYRRYDRRSLARALAAGGFSGTKAQYCNTVGIFGWWLNGRILGRQTPPASQVELFERLLPIVRLVDRCNPIPLGLSLIAASRKDGNHREV